MEKHIVIVPELHKALKVEAMEKGVLLKDYVADILDNRKLLTKQTINPVIDAPDKFTEFKNFLEEAKWR